MARAPAKPKQKTLVQLLEGGSIHEAKVNDDGSITIVFGGNFETNYEEVTVINGTDGCGIAAQITTKSDLAVS